MKNIIILEVKSYDHHNRLIDHPSLEVLKDNEALKFHLKNCHDFSDEMIREALFNFENYSHYIIGHRDNKRETWYFAHKKEVL
jgi:hypothetical protein